MLKKMIDINLEFFLTKKIGMRTKKVFRKEIMLTVKLNGICK